MSVETEMRTEPRDHTVRFYESDDELVAAVTRYLADALRSDERAIVIATPAHTRAFAEALQGDGVDTREALQEGDLVTLDAVDTLSRFLVDGRLDARAFDASIGELVRDLSRDGRPVRAYGEMVALLWDAGQVGTAIELEGLWNELRTRVPFSLFCGYRAQSVAGADHAEALHHVCGLHSEVAGSAPFDAEVEEARGFSPGAHAPRAARRFVVETLHRWGRRDVVDDAAAVIAELAANAVLHARSAFTVVVSVTRGAVRVSVRDGSPLDPLPRDAAIDATSGRGLALVASMSSRWGAEADGDGKVVWAELLPRTAGGAR